MDFLELLRLFQEELSDLLVGPDIAYLAASCKTIFNALLPFINNNVLFLYGQESGLEVYHPKQMKVAGFIGSPSNKGLPFSPTLLPSSLTHLTFNRSFNYPIDNLLPPSLTHLTFGAHFNKPVDHLPSSLTHLHLGEFFSQNIDNLPPSLLHLTHPLRNCNSHGLSCTRLPPNLTYLHISELLENDVPLPDTLTTFIAILVTHYEFPPNLKHLEFLNPHYRTFINIPDSVTTLRLLLHRSSEPLKIDDLPPGLEKLFISGQAILPLPLPSTLTTLSFHGDSPQNIQALGLQNLSNLTELNLNYRQLASGDLQPCYLPPNLTHLDITTARGVPPSLNEVLNTFPLTSFKCSSNLEGEHTFPKSLKVLQIMNYTASAINLPPHLEEFAMNEGSFDHLPPTLKKINLKYQYNNPLPTLPDSLQELYIGVDYNHPLPALPPNLTILNITNNNLCTRLPPLPPLLLQFTLGKEIKERAPKYGYIMPAIYDVNLPALPNSLTHLTLNFRLEEHTLKSLPPRLQGLEVYTRYPLPPLPRTLETLLHGRKSRMDFDT